MADEQLLAHAVDALIRPGPLEPELVGALSHLVHTDLEAVERVWRGLPIDRRIDVLQQLGRSEREHTRHDFNSIYGLALGDDAAPVRRMAIESLVPENGPSLLDRLIDLAQHDSDLFVRTAALGRLAPFALLAELGELPEPWPDRLRSLLLGIVGDSSTHVELRAAALASVGYLDSPAVERAIRAGFDDPALQLAALTAMGRTANPDWLDTLQDEASHPDPAVRQEVARALGELADERAAETVAEMVDDSELEVRLAAIAALGEIGGEEAREALIYALEDERPVVREAAENALNELEIDEDPLKL